MTKGIKPERLKIFMLNQIKEKACFTCIRPSKQEA